MSQLKAKVYATRVIHYEIEVMVFALNAVSDAKREATRIIEEGGPALSFYESEEPLDFDIKLIQVTA